MSMPICWHGRAGGASLVHENNGDRMYEALMTATSLEVVAREI